MKMLKVLEGICGAMVIAGITLIIGYAGGLENDALTCMQFVYRCIICSVVVGVGALGMRYAEAKEEYLARRNRRRY